MSASPRYLLAGQLTRDYAILPNQTPYLDKPGGNLLHSAVGLKEYWEPDPPPALLARVSPEYPQEWLEIFNQRGLDVRGVKVIGESIDHRNFYAYTDRLTRQTDDPVAQFAHAGLQFPKELLGYRAPGANPDSRTQLLPYSLRQSDLPPAYMETHIAHLCPVDYITHTLLPAVLRQAGFTTITIDPSRGYMNPIFLENLPALLTGLTAFLPSEEELRALYYGRSNDLRQMMEAIASYNCEFVIVKRGERGQWVYDAATRKAWEVPAYPGRVTNLTGAGDAFCGGFLAGYHQTFDPLEATLRGNISASLVIEGAGVFYALDALPGLANARLDALRENARQL